jgi:hypothetical protein
MPQRQVILLSTAYQLARFSRPFRSAFLQVFERDPDIHTQAPRYQYEDMTLGPLREVANTLPENAVAVIDALDECENSYSRCH